MRTIITNRTKTIATKIRSNKLSYLKCIKLERTKKDFKPAMSKATVTVKGPRCIEVMLIVRKVRNNSTNKILDNVLYSIVCVVLFAINFKFNDWLLKLENLHSALGN